jgi:acetyltransferase-like isoleucine patch superfamily enzyme
MGIAARIRKGQGPFWGTLKWLARKVLTLHIPVGPLTRPLFRLLYRCHVLLREGILWALRFFWNEPLFRSQCASVGEGFQMEHLPYMTGSGRIVIGSRVRFGGKPSFGFSNRVHAAPEVRIGDHTFIGHLVSFNAADSIRIGNHCLLAEGVRLSDFDGHPVDWARRRAGEPTPPEAIHPIEIGDDVWVGVNCIILKGVTIGSRSVIAAGSVVSRDVPPDVVVAGIPARVVKHLTPPEAEPPHPRPLAPEAGARGENDCVPCGS